jgi:hypothetical protein
MHRSTSTTQQRPGVRHLGLGLTETEAREVRLSLDALLLDPRKRHEHVASADFQHEPTIWLVRPQFGVRSRALAQATVPWLDRLADHAALVSVEPLSYAGERGARASSGRSLPRQAAAEKAITGDGLPTPAEVRIGLLRDAGYSATFSERSS